MIPLQSVTSSMIDAIGYESGTLAVKFSNGDIWEYTDVPEDVYHPLMDSQSKGSAFHRLDIASYGGQRVA